MLIDAILIILALTAANFIYQFFSDKEYETALERSYFQAVAVLITWYNLKG
jgi:hypothetical protein